MKKNNNIIKRGSARAWQSGCVKEKKIILILIKVFEWEQKGQQNLLRPTEYYSQTYFCATVTFGKRQITRNMLERSACNLQNHQARNYEVYFAANLH